MTFELILIASLVIAICYWLEENTWWALHLSGVVLIILVASILSNSAIIPATKDAYKIFFHWGVPLGIALMLMALNLKEVGRIKKEFLICFTVGAMGSTLGGIVAGLLFANILPHHYWQAAGQLTASLIGGYENAVAVGSALNIPTEIFVLIFAGDTIIGVSWLLINIYRGKKLGPHTTVDADNNTVSNFINNQIDMTSLAIMVALAFGIVFISNTLPAVLPKIPGLKIMLVSLLATLIAFTPLRHRLASAHIIGAALLSYFFFACGAISDVVALLKNGTILLLFLATIVVIHAIVLFSFTSLLNIKKDIAITTSHALIGGPAGALAIVMASKWNYRFEAVMLGLLGYAVANYIGLGVAFALKN